ncbi:type VI secretion protein [Serratia marcescens]|uniref:Type VI secretion protein n=1 Tax=Serratia marcescens TaxID=615 RepID=A0ABX5N5Q0_SERMA|nr:type VI secretion protein [Serratia marcescens]PYA18637.1 type VI secretion protein [Serratia marcescens]PYA23207.1 type VI secretion protein [Serratia marcescens]PYA28856.1 type VI secretion protein [Serratia marcescens]PYA31928.1 type VI secretion protein [Serratia marcescens]
MVVIKGGYQIGADSRLGISVVAGCYLSRPEHFVNEAEIWEAWKRAPLSLPVLDVAEPKPFAEYLIAGHAGVGQPVKTLDVSADIGGLKRRWRVEGEGRRGAMGAEPFLSVPLDHTSAWGGKDSKENPVGRGCNDGLRPLLMTLSAEGSAQERSPLAAPAPVPHEFALRKAHIDKVAGQIASKAYLEKAFPGLPADIDRRYYQMAPPAQWLPEAAWPDRVPFELQGVGAQSQAIRGELPAVRGRAFIRRHDSEGLEEIELQRKTLWFLPDSDMALIIFTGNAPLTHLLDESIESLMLALDRCDAPRPFDYFRQVHHKRSDDDASPFEFLFDPDLMPAEMGLNVIQAASDHPSDLRYDPSPMSLGDSAVFYQRIREAIVLHQQQTAAEPAPVTLPDLPDLPAEDGNDAFFPASATVEGKTFTGLRSPALSDKHFLQCRFERCDFSQAVLENCTFENCVFDAVNLTQAALRRIRMVSCTLQKPLMAESVWQEAVLEKVTLEEPQGQGMRAEGVKLDYCVFERGDFTASRFERGAIGNGMFNGSALIRTQFLQGELDACVFNRCLVEGAVALDMAFIKNSFLGGNWRGVRFERCRIESMTAGMQVNFSHGVFSDCCFTKVGLKAARMERCQLQYSVFTECNFDEADLTACAIVGCDMAGVRFKDSVLTHARWQNSSAQQAMFYNADLRDAGFEQCNLAAANLAMTWQDAGTRFSGCLLERACWVPRRIIQGDYAHEN